MLQDLLVEGSLEGEQADGQEASEELADGDLALHVDDALQFLYVGPPQAQKNAKGVELGRVCLASLLSLLQ